MLKELRFVIVLGGILVLSGCASTKEEIRPSDEKPDDQLQQIRSLEERAKILKEKVAPTLDDSINELVQQISKDMTVQKKTTIAVIDFTNLEGNVTNFGRYLTEELITRLFQTGKFKVIERNLLNKVIEEQKLSLTQLIDPASAKQLGRILGVDAIVSGTIGDLVKQLKVNARIIGTEKGDVFAVAQTAINKDETVIKLMGEGVRKPSVVTTKPTTATTIKPTAGTSDNLVINGDFEQDLSVGWKKVIDWDQNNVANAGVNWAKIEPELFDSKNVLHLYHKGISQISLIQEIPVSTTDLEFSISTKLFAAGYSGDGHNYNGTFFWLEFQDDTGRVLGDIWWRAWSYGWHTSGLTNLIDSPVRRVVVQEGLNRGSVDIKWKTYTINLRDEFSTYMVGVEKAKVKKIVIKMLCHGKGTANAPSELWIDNITLREIE